MLTCSQRICSRCVVRSFRCNMQDVLTTRSIDTGKTTVSSFAVGLVFTAAILNEFFSIDPIKLRSSYGIFSPYYSMMLATIYGWKFVIAKQAISRDTKELKFFCLLAVMLPFLYWRCVLFPNMSTFSRIVANPIWIFAIPFISFFKFDLKRMYINDNEYWKRSCIEMFIISPAWSICFGILLWATNLVENWRAVFWGC